MSIVLFSYRANSVSARQLAEKLGVIRTSNPNGIVNRADVVINWGSSRCPVTGPHVINQPHCVAVATNKAYTFRAWKNAYNLALTGSVEPRVTQFYPDFHDENHWSFGRARDRQEPVFGAWMARTTLTGYGGRGCVIVPHGGVIPVDAKMVTRYIKPKNEYRVHVMNGQVIRTQEKRPSRPDADPYVRNHANGYKFYLGGIAPDPNRDACAINAVRTLGLDFGAVDIVYGRQSMADSWEYVDRYFALEVNTAPGLNGESAADLYADSLRNLYNLTRGN